jgi:putative PIG3 family NAD(P)H quinone oxidoreductase
MALPADMRAVIQNRAGGPEVLEVVRLPVPKPGPDQVLIRVAWAGVNPHDFGQRKRGHPPAGHTPIFGLECAGEIVAVGERVDKARIGEKVCALVQGGAYADYCLSESCLAFGQSPALSERENGAIMENLFTVWFNMIDIAGLKPGERVLIHGGTGNIGSTAIQIARLIGAEAYATVGTEEKRAIALSLGATRVVNYRTEDFVSVVKEATRGEGVHVVLDPVAADGYAAKNIDVLVRDGRLSYVSANEGRAMVPVASIMQKRAQVYGSMLRTCELARKQKIATQMIPRVWPVLGGDIKPLIDSEFPLEACVEAHRRGESGQTTGKVQFKVT